MESQTSSLRCLSLLILSLHFFQTCNGNANSDICTPSSCGIIRNISFPFRLTHDPNNCGDHRFELACENNVTFLYVNSLKFYVKAINYGNSTIMLADPSINKDDICSFPTFYADEHTYFYNNMQLYYYFDNVPINFISCPNPLKNSPLTDITHCTSSNSSHPTSYTYTYIEVGDFYASNLAQGCILENIWATSWEFKDLKNASLSEIHQSLFYGFQLRFYRPAPFSTWHKFVQFLLDRLTGHMLIVLVIVVFLSAVISSPVVTIIGFVVVVGLVLHVAFILYCKSNITLSIIMICGARFIIYPLIVWLLIHKFRTRRLSLFEDIESFLQSDNKLNPIRYSYSDLKKITRGFRDKLGEGGYGSVYKGKLRSGHHVAVKILGKSGGNGQDFMNEIATIGRIHHVNVVQLVGYCAQGSKCALVYDFMPNGSLEKFLFNREKASSLSLDVKFEIAVGVARGIEYLHRGCDVQILHFDIKPHNILLDDKYVPKLSDFGLAKLCSTDKNAVTMTAARGTIGYVAPELINRSIGAVSYKADVYSFGMLLMEMVGLNREIKGNKGDSSKYFPCWIYDHLNQGMEIEIEDEEESNGNEEEETSRKSVVRKMTVVALWCIQMNPDDRPSMNIVLKMLEGDVERLHIPAYPSQSAHVAENDEESWVTSASNSISLPHDKNGSSNIEITIT